MFISFLLPFVDRGAGPLFRWVMLAQMSRFDVDEIAFIGDAGYFDESAVPFGEVLSIAGITFAVPSRERFRQYKKVILGEQVRLALAPEKTSHLDLFRSLLTTELDPLAGAIRGAVEQLAAAPECEAFLTWCNCPSLRMVADGLGVPVIHNELGALRAPAYRNTVYFDFSGVNGSSTPAAWQCPDDVLLSMVGADLLSEETLQALLSSVPASAAPGRGQKERDYVGVALQVEDDSNIVAFGDGWDALRLIYHANAQHPGQPILVRGHPHARFAYAGGLGRRDTSHDSIAFLSRVQQLYAINSSLLSEALFWSVPFRAMGDCPVRPFSDNGTLAQLAHSHREVVLNAYFVAYLVPAELLFCVDYYRWRLEEPRTLAECHERHLAALREAASKGPGGYQPVLSPEPAAGSGEGTPSEAADDWLTNQRLDRKLAVLESEVARLSAAGSVSTHEFQQRDAVIAELRSHLDDRAQAIAWLESQQANFEAELAGRDASLQALSDHLEERNRAIAWLESQQANLEAELAARDASLQALADHLEERNQAIAWLEAQRSDLNEELAARGAALNELSSHLQDRVSAIAWLEQKRSFLEDEIASRDAQLRELSAYLGNREDAVAWLEAQRLELQHELGNREAELDQARASLQAQHEAIRRYRSQRWAVRLERLGRLNWQEGVEK